MRLWRVLRVGVFACMQSGRVLWTCLWRECAFLLFLACAWRRSAAPIRAVPLVDCRAALGVRAVVAAAAGGGGPGLGSVAALLSRSCRRQGLLHSVRRVWGCPWRRRDPAGYYYCADTRSSGRALGIKLTL